MEYVHIHSDFSNGGLGFRDSTNSIKALVARHKELGCSAVMLTDHACVSGHVELEMQCNKAGLKAIYGSEIYLTREDLDNTNFERGERFYHFLLMAKNRKGWAQLNELTTMAHKRSFVSAVKRVPNYMSDLVRVVNAGGQNLVATSACLGGLFNPLIQEWHRTRDENIKNEIINRIQFFNELFGHGNFYLEIQPALYEEQQIYNSWLGVFGQATGTPLIVGVDAHYLNKEDFNVHKAYLNSQEGKARETEDFYKYTYLMQENEVRENLTQCSGLTDDMINNAILNTEALVAGCEEFSISSPIRVPRTELPPQHTWSQAAHKYIEFPIVRTFVESANDVDRFFISQVMSGFEKYVNKGVLAPHNIERICDELQTVWDVGVKINDNLGGYFTTLQRILDVIWKLSIVGAGRGSAGGFLINFVMDITQVNPLDYDLPAWR